jgi:hypothetical protein
VTVTHEPILVRGEDETITDMVYQAIGAASVAWGKDGVFQDGFAKQIGDDLIAIINEQADAETSRLLNHLEAAWGIIANASDWHLPEKDERGRWVPYAQQWRDQWHEIIKDFMVQGEPEEPIEEAPQILRDIMVIETTRKGKYVRSYGPFTSHEADQFALDRLREEIASGGRHEFVLDLPQVIKEQPRTTIEGFLSWLDTVAEDPNAIFKSDVFEAPTEPQWSTADLDQRDRFPNRPLTEDDVNWGVPSDPWPTAARHRKPWSGD